MKRLTQIILAALVIMSGAVAFAQGEDAPSQQLPDGTAQTSSKSEAEISRTTVEVSNEVMSPFCPGKTLAMCPSPAAAEVRRDIQQMASQGDDTETIKRKLIEEYGDEFEIIEPGRFDDALILGLIIFGLLLCLAVVLLISKRGKGRGDEDDDSDQSDGGSNDGGSTGPTLSGAEDGALDDSYLSTLRDEYRS